MAKTKYAVLDHHSMWGWEKMDCEPEDADIVFVWNDFSIEEQIKSFKSKGKKVICFEHGWNAFFDYEYNNHEPIADGYITLGPSSAKSLERKGIPKGRILVSGNPNFDNIGRESTETQNLIPQVLFTALHWTRDMRDFNNGQLKKIIDVLGPYTDITVKTIEKSKIDIPEQINEWRSEINDNTNLFQDIKQGLQKFDIILTSKESTFDFIALKMGKKVFRIADEKDYYQNGDPRTRNILNKAGITPELLFSQSSIMLPIENELSESIKINKIIHWATNL